MKRAGYQIALSVLLCAAASCGNCGGSARTCPHTVTVNEPAESACVGEVRGTVFFDGAVPKNPELVMSSEAHCAAAHSGAVREDAVLVSNGRLANVLVYVRNGLEAYTFATPQIPVMIDNAGCLYVPHVGASQTHQVVRFTNKDPIIHDIHAPSVGVSLVLSKNGDAADAVFCSSKSGIELRCKVHSWMTGYLHVVDHPYFAVTDTDGTFAFPRKLPAGTYVLEAWHERAGIRTADLIVPSDGTSPSVEFHYWIGE